MAIQRSCDVCGFYRQSRDGSSAVSRYSLSRVRPEGLEPTARFSLRKNWREDGRIYSRGAGAIDLCAECWERIAKPKMRPLAKAAK